MTQKPTVVSSTKLTPKERRVVEAAARARGLKLSPFLRAVVVPAAREELRRAAAIPEESDLPPAA